MENENNFTPVWLSKPKPESELDIRIHFEVHQLVQNGWKTDERVHITVQKRNKSERRCISVFSEKHLKKKSRNAVHSYCLFRRVQAVNIKDLFPIIKYNVHFSRKLNVKYQFIIRFDVQKCCRRSRSTACLATTNGSPRQIPKTLKSLE